MKARSGFSSVENNETSPAGTPSASQLEQARKTGQPRGLGPNVDAQRVGVANGEHGATACISGNASPAAPTLHCTVTFNSSILHPHAKHKQPEEARLTRFPDNSDFELQGESSAGHPIWAPWLQDTLQGPPVDFPKCNFQHRAEGSSLEGSQGKHDGTNNQT